MQKLNVIDLFSGCGGLSFGFQQTGKYRILVGVDNCKDALDTFVANHKRATSLNLDLAQSNFTDQLKEYIKTDKVDIIVGGPPCQGFSLTGPRNFEDKRNILYMAMFQAIKDFEPKAFLIENVPGLAVMYKGAIKDKIIKRAETLGYNVAHRILLAADYGVPQMRKRIFMIGIKKTLQTFSFPQPVHNEKTYVSCSAAISDLPPRIDELGREIDEYQERPRTEYQRNMREGSLRLMNHVASDHTNKIKKVISLVPNGGNYKNLPKGVGQHRQFNEAWTRYHSDKPSKTIDTGHRNHFHYKWNRIPTVRENARLQSFPDHFIVKGSKTSQHRQIGNAVPPLVSKAIAEEIYKAVR